jgi:uncharacterized protein (TIGR02117 family)
MTKEIRNPIDERSNCAGHVDRLRSHSCDRLAVASLAFVLMVGCHGPVRGLYPPRPDELTRIVYVPNNHWHTGIVLKLSDLSDDQRRLFDDFSEFSRVEVGWGDDAYYRAEKATIGNTLQAACVPTPSVLHIVGIDAVPEGHYAYSEIELYRVELSEAGFKRLVEFVANAFETDEQDKAIYLQPGLQSESGFYRAKGMYCGCRMCNHWTAEALRAAGMPITPTWAVTADDVGGQLRRIEQVKRVDR